MFSRHRPKSQGVLSNRESALASSAIVGQKPRLVALISCHTGAKMQTAPETIHSFVPQHYDYYL